MSEPVLLAISSLGLQEMAEVASVLSSRMFLRAYNSAALLNYVCQEHAQGRSAGIKEYNIAVDALGRKTNFDPASDSLVRVEATRLRQRLRHFYATEGAAHALEIQLPDVGYAPRFVQRSPAGPAAPLALEPSEPEPFPIDPQPAAKSKAVKLAVAMVGIVLGAALVAVVTYGRRTSTRPPAVAMNPAVSVPSQAVGGTEPVRIAVGSNNPRYVDRSGQVWLGDRYYKGGEAIAKPERRILRTLDPSRYQEAREGEFQYDVPLRPGMYELHLHFAEIVHRETLGSGVEGQRRFHVALNGKPLLTNFDIVLDAPGADTADERVFQDVAPAPDGFLHLAFTPVMSKAILSGIEILPAPAHRMLPVRILAGSRALYDRSDRFWAADRYFSGGRSLPRLAPVKGTNDPGVFANERFGNFSYFVPVPEGLYSVALRFAESNFGVDNIGSPTYASGGRGSRVFNIYCNGIALARNFDVYQEAGGPLLALVKTFRNLRPNAQGKLVFTFEAVNDYPIVSAIEVLDESK